MAIKLLKKKKPTINFFKIVKRLDNRSIVNFFLRFNSFVQIICSAKSVTFKQWLYFLFWLESFEEMLIKPTYTNMKEKIWQLLPKEKQKNKKKYIEGLKEPIHNPFFYSE